MSVLTWWLDATAGHTQSASMLAPSMVCLGAPGRYAPLHQGLIGLAAFDVVLGGSAGWSVANLAFALLCLGGPLIFGRLVRRRTEGAGIAEQVLADQIRLDPTALAAAVIATERGRLANETVGVVRTAVQSMRNAAAVAADDLNAEALAAIQDTGRAAIAELRRLLGLLRREEPGPAAAPHRRDIATGWWTSSPPPVSPRSASPRLPTWASGGIVSVVLVLLLCATVAFRRLHPALACMTAALVYAASLLLQVPLAAGVGGGLVTVLLAWSVTTEGSRRGWIALGLLLAADAVQTQVFAPGTETISVVALLLGALCGYLWAECPASCSGQQRPGFRLDQ